ncbi:HNH endonuclease [Thiorhodococcus drewsii AZ1]|uniref:HNH endonuclease n=1 Tax=Thiorhodococcus drewsii AZ1 TaxID=765913 RepID=G2E8M8_9GAMM|nr:HNH endonuclease signature motif containing protein [Thiorhodococcus drewsii]EGV27544.1 HNH endonuclease [Thiorhodococcus drewsii AZ1]
MVTYYYAYHGPDNAESFNFKTGYGVSQKYKQEQTNIGDRVFIIQKRKKNNYFELCGVFEIVGHYHDSKSLRPHRMKLEDYSKLPEFVELPENKISKSLPKAKGDQRWSVFKRHFCRQGVSFQSPLKEEVVSILNSYIPRSFLLEDVLKNFEEEVLRSLKLSESDRQKRLNSAERKPEKKTVEVTIYNRNPDVVAEVLEKAKGLCGICGKKAPFNKRTNGLPYLEVHHRVQLSKGGEDTIENTIALCPNCHREQYYG